MRLGRSGASSRRREGAFQAYLRQAVMNRIRDEMRRRRTRPATATFDELGARASASSPLEDAIGLETFERYEAALARLTPNEREAIVGRVELGRPTRSSPPALEQAVGRRRPHGGRARARPPGGGNEAWTPDDRARRSRRDCRRQRDRLAATRCRRRQIPPSDRHSTELKAIAALATLHRAPDGLADDGAPTAGARWGPLTFSSADRRGPLRRGLSRVGCRDCSARSRSSCCTRRPRASATSPSHAIEEARLLARVRHPNVLTVHGAECIDGQVGIWMEFIEGRTLEASCSPSAVR